MNSIHLFAVFLFLLICLTVVNVILDSNATSHVTPLRLFLSVVIPSFIVIKAFKKNNLSKSGALCAWFVGFLLTNFSYIHTCTMLVFFFTSSRLTKFGAERKKRIENDYENASRRDWQQVVANGGVMVMFALLSIIRFGLAMERPIDLTNSYLASWYDLAITGALACATGDTWSSEVGSAYGSSQPWLISTLKRVPAGTNGAVSFVGLFSSLIGGFVIGISYYIFAWFFCPVYTFSTNPPQYYVILVASLSGLVGSLIDSFLGATVQFSGFHQETKLVVPEPANNVKKICGRNLLSNNSVNLLATLFTSFIAPFIALKFVYEFV